MTIRARTPNRRSIGLAAGAVVLGLLIAGPADGKGTQPAPGSKVAPTATHQNIPKQPAPGFKVAPTAQEQNIPQQPANAHPDLSGASTHVKGKAEKATPNVAVKGRTDKGGASGSDTSGGRTD